MPEDISDLAEAIAQRANQRSLRVAAAESLTSGQICGALGAASGASEWFAGGVVAYRNKTKFDVLGVTPGPVMTATCAEQMARGVVDLTASDVAVSVTGVGGPGSEEGRAAGTVFIGIATTTVVRSFEYAFTGDPEEVVTSTVRAALDRLTEALDDA